MIWQKLFSKPIGKGPQRALKVVAVIAVIYGAFFFYLNRFSFMSSQELKQKMSFKTYCIGRLAIDLPADATIKWGIQRINYIKMTSEPFTNASKETLDYRLEQRAKVVSEMPHEKFSKAFLRAEEMNTPHGKLLEYYSNPDYDREFSTEAIFATEGRLITLIDTNYLQGDEPPSPSYDHPNGKSRTQVLKIASSISVPPTQLPEAGGGSCVDGVFISGPDIIKEDIEATAYFDDIELSINTVAMEKELIKPTEDSMLERMAKVPAIMFSELEDKRLRSRSRSINGTWKAEEFGSADKTVGGYEGYSFMLEANQPKAGLTTPELTIEMKASRQVHSQSEILVIWDTIIDSIRPRLSGLAPQ